MEKAPAQPPRRRLGGIPEDDRRNRRKEMSEKEIEEAAEIVTPEVLPAHHRLGPSCYTSWSECPCFESRGGDGGEMAVRGTYAHKVVAALIGSQPVPARTPEEERFVSLDDIDAAEWFVNQVQVLSAGHQLHSEQKILFNAAMAADCPELEGVFGTVDVWHDDEFGQLHIYDFKTFDRGEKDHTPQMEGYAVLICSNMPQYIGKPIYLHVGAGGIREIVSYVTNFGDACKHVLSIIARHLSPSAAPTPADCCKYCAKAANCDGANQVVAAARDELVWSGLSMAARRVVVDSLKSIIKGFEAEFSKYLDEHGDVCEDAENGICFKRVQQKPNRVCTSITGLGTALADHNIPADQFIDRICSVSRARVVEALVAANPGMRKSAAEAVAGKYFAVPAGAEPKTKIVRVA